MIQPARGQEIEGYASATSINRGEALDLFVNAADPAYRPDIYRMGCLSVPPRDPASPAGWEYNMVRWLEREGYDVTYSTNLDTHASATLPDGRQAWLSRRTVCRRHDAL